jgi:hypothetical protein
MQVENAKLQREVAKKTVETTTEQNPIGTNNPMSKLFFNRNKERQV